MPKRTFPVPCFRHRSAGVRRIGLVVSFISFMGGADLAAQQTPLSPPSQAARLIPRPIAATPLSIDAGDLIDVQVFNTPELSSAHRIGADGSIELPGTGAIKVAGLPPLEAGTLIEKRLRDAQIMLDPHVSVTVTEYTTEGITVLGEVKIPGTYPLLGQQSLYTALAAAGGVTPQEGATITVTHRATPSLPEVIRVRSSSYAADERLTLVQPGDVVFVSQAGAIYVIGDVEHPGQYFLSNGEPLRALNALALAQGLKESAAPNKASIIRRTDSGAETIPVDLRLIQKNEALDPVLEPSDILVVPRSGMKTFLNATLPGASSAVVNAAALALIYR